MISKSSKSEDDAWLVGDQGSRFAGSVPVLIGDKFKGAAAPRLHGSGFSGGAVAGCHGSAPAAAPALGSRRGGDDKDEDCHGDDC